MQRINDIANDLLAKSRDREVSALSPVAPPTRVLGLVSEKRNQYRNFSNIQIAADLENSFGLFVDIVPQQMMRVISNLLNNSVEAMNGKNGGLISVRVGHTQETVVIYIEDDGQGIPPSNLNSV